MRITELTTEYRKNPVGLDATPRFSWKIQSGRNNTMQERYRILVRDSEKDVWDSGEVRSDQSLFVKYRGKKLRPFTRYRVEVIIRDNHGETDMAEGFFETGLLLEENWRGEWITHSFPKEETACPVFQKHFLTEGKKIRSARAYVTCRGVYELAVNGEKAGDAFLAPGWTSYQKRIQYQTYDITGLLVQQESPDGAAAEQAVQITVGNGWYKGYLSGEGKNCFFGERVAVLAMFRIEYEDGTVQIVGTDPGWEVATGPIRYSELYHGEKQNFSYEKTDGGEPAVRFELPEPAAKIVAQQAEPVRVVQKIPVKEKIITPKGELVLDFGQNLAGFVEVCLPEPEGSPLVLCHGETLDREGNFYTGNLRTAKSRDEYRYTVREAGRTVHPHFTYHGFRYVRLEGVGRDVDESLFHACVLHTDFRQTGHFSCSNALVSRLQENIVWSGRGNLVDIPTDCPQRDERLGWSGDAQIASSTAMYNFQTALLFKKWLKDLAADSDEQNGIPQMAPNIAGASTGTAVWGDAATIVPWNLYQTYGDEEVLREQYPNMKLWVDYITDSCKDGVLWMNGFQRGDWLGLDGEECLHTMNGGTDKDLVANVYYAYSCRIVRDTARILGETVDATKYGDLYERIVEELNREYVTKNGRLVSETQTACALFLHFDLIREEYRGRVIRILEDNLNQHHGHLTTGFVGTAYLCHALTENGLHHLAEEILLTEDYPGWLYAIKRGATTVWERWDSIHPDGTFDQSGMNSLNHCAYGSVGDWLYRKVAGINPLEKGYKKILVKPIPTRGLSEVDASFNSMYGVIASHISCKGGRITVDVTIPANTTAVLELPERREGTEIGSGTWHFEYPTETNLEHGNYSMNSTVGEILAKREAAQVLEKYMPVLKDPSVLAFIRGKTLSEMAALAPQQKELLGALLKELNR